MKKFILQTCRLIASNFTIKQTPSQVFFDSILSPSPMLPLCFNLSPPPSNFEEPPLPPPHPHVLNTCGKPCFLSLILGIPSPYHSDATFVWSLIQFLILQKNFYLKSMIYNFFRMVLNLYQGLTYQNDPF